MQNKKSVGEPADFCRLLKKIYIKLIRTKSVEPQKAAINFTMNSLKGVLSEVSSEIWLLSQ